VAVKITDLNGMNLIFKKQDSAIENAFWTIKALAIKPGKEFYVSSREIQKQLILANIACGFASEGNLKYYNNISDIKLVPITDKRFSINMKIAFKREKHLSEEAKQFKQFVLDYFQIKEE